LAEALWTARQARGFADGQSDWRNAGSRPPPVFGVISPIEGAGRCRKDYFNVSRPGIVVTAIAFFPRALGHVFYASGKAHSRAPDARMIVVPEADGLGKMPVSPGLSMYGEIQAN